MSYMVENLEDRFSRDVAHIEGENFVSSDKSCLYSHDDKCLLHLPFFWPSCS